MDEIESAINELKSKTLDEVREMMQKLPSKNQAIVAVKSGELISTTNSQLESLGSGDSRVKQAIAELKDIFTKIVMGKNPFGDE